MKHRPLQPGMLLSLLLIIMTGIFILPSAHAQEIGLAWAGSSGMAERVTKGFEKGLSDVLPKANIEYQKELPSIEALAMTAKKWENSKKAMVLLRSNAAEWLSTYHPNIPTFIGACNHPVQLGAVKSFAAPGGNVTGVTYYIPVDTQFEIYQAILADLRSILLLVDAGHPGAAIDREATKAYADQNRIVYKEALCNSVEDAVSAVKEQKDAVSAIIFGNQALLLDNAETIISSAPNEPFLSYASRPVKAGALGGVVADDFKLGYMLAESVAEVLNGKKPVSQVPVKTDPNPKFVVNTKKAASLGVEIPFDILEAAEIVE